MSRLVPDWARTARVRIALVYSALLFGITALILGGAYLVLSQTMVAEPLDPVTVKKFTYQRDGTIAYVPGEQFQAADLASVQKAVNYATLQTLRNYSLVALLVMFVLSLLIGWLVAGRVLRPVGAIIATTREITATDLSKRIGASGPRDELRVLADTIDGMLDRLEGAFTSERKLVADVSHELRNPVAVVQANVEAVLASEASTPVQRQEAAAVVSRATSRMSRLLEDLLATARTRSSAFEDAEVNLASVAEDVAGEYETLAARRGQRLHMRLGPGPVVFAEREALDRALSNLLSNAVRLAPDQSTITVGVGSRDGWAWLAVRDEGPGVAEADRGRIFDRFERGTGDRSSGTGLGLAIARQIVESHEGRLVLCDQGEGPGATFVIWLPERSAVARPGRLDAPPPINPLG